LLKRLFDGGPYGFRRFDRWKLLQERDSLHDLIAFGPAAQALPEVELDLLRLWLWELAVEMSRQQSRNVPRKHR